mmetsp:Transcript_81447/g.226443  ORF Transcript_81447/g.226443 Transcript_81447/m.226443 type:complete len:490 (-) Transcript_81447:241-1710(-)
MGRLVLLVVGVGDEHRGQAVEAQLAIRLGVADAGALGRGAQGLVVGLVVVQRPGRVGHAQLGQQPVLDAGHQLAGGLALLEPELEVAGLLQLFVQPALLEGLGVGAQLVLGAAGRQGGGQGLGAEHAALDRRVAALDAGGIQVAGIAADQRTAGEDGLGQGLGRAVVDRTGAVADALAAFEVGADGRVGLPALHLLEGAEVGVAVVQADDETQRDLVVGQVVEEAAAEGVTFHRPAGGVHHLAGLGLVGGDLPQLLDADREGLGVLAFGQAELGEQLLAEVAAGAFGEHGVFAEQLHAELEVVAGLAVLAQAHVAGCHALDPALLVVEHLGRGEAGEDLHAQALGLLGHPLDHVGQADHIAAVVVEVARHQPVGRAGAAGLAEEEHVVAGHGLVQRRAELLPVREQLGDGARVHHRAGQDVGAGLRALFEHDDAGVGIQLLEPDGRGEAGRAATDDDHVVLHGLAGAELGQDFFGCHAGSPSALNCARF